jgi:hypothetical protein
MRRTGYSYSAFKYYAHNIDTTSVGLTTYILSIALLVLGIMSVLF